MRKRQRVLSIVIVVILCIFHFCIPAGAESARDKKIVSIVYDDSGSMYFNEQLKWCYANYAMQAFAGMLNKEDILMINYMSSVQVGNNNPVTVDTNNRVNSVEMIRSHITDMDTPYAAVDSAYNNLISYQDTNPNTQYWLVIMTDGQFNNTLLSDVEDKLCTFADSSMPNGSLPHIVFLSICDSEKKFTPAENLRSNINVKRTDIATQIADAISEISDEISGRYTAKSEDIKIIDERTIEVTSKIPLINIGVLSQLVAAEVSSVTSEDTDSIIVESNVPIIYPEAKGRNTDKDLIGNVALIGDRNGNIPKGKYRIQFSAPVNMEKLNVMLEPAVELRLSLSCDGKPVEDLTRIKTHMVLDAKAEIYETGTDNIIDLSLLPEGVKCSISHTEGERAVKSETGLDLTEINLNATETTVSAKVNLAGYFELKDELTFNPYDFIVNDIKSSISYDGSERREYKNKETGTVTIDTDTTVYVSDLKTNKTGAKFVVSVNNQPIDKLSAEELLPKFRENINTKLWPCRVLVADDGSFIVYPTKKPFWYPSVFYWLFNHGEQTISVEIDGVSASQTLNIKLGDAKCLADIIPFLIILWILSWLFIKKHFKGQKIIYIVAPDNGTRNPYKDIRPKIAKFYYVSFDLNPIKAQSKGLDFGIKVEATGGDSVIISGIKNKLFSKDGTNLPVMKSDAENKYELIPGQTCQVKCGGMYMKITLKNQIKKLR